MDKVVKDIKYIVDYYDINYYEIYNLNCIIYLYTDIQSMYWMFHSSLFGKDNYLLYTLNRMLENVNSKS